jgi:hypothetical protein
LWHTFRFKLPVWSSPLNTSTHILYDSKLGDVFTYGNGRTIIYNVGGKLKLSAHSSVYASLGKPVLKVEDALALYFE